MLWELLRLGNAVPNVTLLGRLEACLGLAMRAASIVKEGKRSGRPPKGEDIRPRLDYTAQPMPCT